MTELVWVEPKVHRGNIVILASMRQYKGGKGRGNTQSPPTIYSKHDTSIPATNPTNQPANIKGQGWTIGCVFKWKGPNLTNASLIYGVGTHNECRKNGPRKEKKKTLVVIQPVYGCSEKRNRGQSWRKAIQKMILSCIKAHHKKKGY